VPIPRHAEIDERLPGTSGNTSGWSRPRGLAGTAGVPHRADRTAQHRRGGDARARRTRRR